MTGKNRKFNLLKSFTLSILILTFLSSSGLSEEPDIDGNGAVGLADAVVALKVVAGIDIELNCLRCVSIDVNKDNKIGLEEAIYILNVLSGNMHPYEKNDEYGNANQIIPDGPYQRHNFHEPGDADWVMFYGAEGETYEINAQNVGDNCNTKLELYRYDDIEMDIKFVTSVSYAGYGKGKIEILILRDCDQEGVYFVKVTHTNPSKSGEETAYDLYVSVADMPLYRGAIVGYVFSSPPYSLVDGLTISLLNTRGQSRHTYYFNSNGTYYAFGLEKDTYTITAEANGYKTYSAEVTVGLTTIRRDIWMSQ